MIRTTKIVFDVKTIWVRLPYLHDKGDELKRKCLRKIRCLTGKVKFTIYKN